MDLYKGELYWNKTMKTEFNFEKLNENISSDVLIVGGGMSGSLCAYVLSSNGFNVTVMDKGKIGRGSSSANTGLLQYSSDKRISEFSDDIGEDKAVLFYKMCLEAMGKLTGIVDKLEDETDYIKRESINYASKKEDENLLLKDYEILKRYNFPVEFLDNQKLKSEYKIDKVAALRTFNDAEVNPFKLIQALTKMNLRQGVKYYENTEINLDDFSDNKAVTKEGKEIKFKNLILATGYAKVYPVIENKCNRYITYAFCSKPVKKELWKNNAMIWETKMPYLYFRSTKDNRIIAGGLDEKLNSSDYNNDKIKSKTKEIARQIKKLFPNLNIEIEFEWAALFFGSKDGLPFIGRDPNNSNIYYLLGYEGNGTCYSAAGAYILNDIIKGNKNIYETVVKIDR
ncbi:MAG: FAD-dependent oxidoreductase [Clostridium sp.]|nr:FAD-dependent oxidoreductase [Clostridium sp.]